MIRYGLLAFLACLLLVACEEKRPPEPVQTGAPALWVIENKNGATAGWLFGTIHALPDGARWQTAKLDRAVAAAGVLVVEVRDLNPARLSADFRRLATNRPGPPLADRLALPVRADVAELLERGGKSSSEFDALETWAAALAIAQLGDVVKSGNGVDKALLAEFAGRPIRELEGAANQLAIFDALPERDQRAMLAAVIQEQDRAQTDADALARAWLAGDAARMERVARTGLLADPALYEILLARRNRGWAAAILPMLDDGQRPLIAVGAAHLLGPDGIPALLEAKGYTVRRIQ